MPTAHTALALLQLRGALQCKANIGGLGGIVQAPGVAEATSCANQRVPKQAWALNVLLLHEAGVTQARMGVIPLSRHAAQAELSMRAILGEGAAYGVDA